MRISSLKCLWTCRDIIIVLYGEGGRVKKFDGHREKGSPVAFCGAPRCSQSATEGAAVGVQCCMQGVRCIVQDVEQFPQHPLLRPLLLRENAPHSS